MRIQNNIYEIKDKTLICILPWEYTEVIEVSKTIQYFILKYNFDSANKIIKSFYNIDAENLSLINSFYDNPVIQCTDEQFKYFLNVFDMLRDELGEDPMPRSSTRRSSSSLAASDSRRIGESGGKPVPFAL